MRMHRSHSKKKQDKKAPKRTVHHYKDKSKGKHTCAECGAVLHGVSRQKKMPRTPSRMYGGYLCPTCLREKLVESVRS
ncbi:MAG: 50S ribosomal protein L34e [Candidatus Methanofastidiosia archaeon]